MAGKLTPKQEKFCREYVKDFNGTQAAIRAGYSEKTANEQAAQLLAKLSISEFVVDLQKKQNEELEIDAADITLKFLQIRDRCMQAEPVLDKNGEPTGEFKFDARAAIQANEMLGKRVGYFEVDNKQKKPDAVVNLANLTFEELMKLKGHGTK